MDHVGATREPPTFIDADATLGPSRPIAIAWCGARKKWLKQFRSGSTHDRSRRGDADRALRVGAGCCAIAGATAGSGAGGAGALEKSN